MNATIESLFGPPSEGIDIPEFIQAAALVGSDQIDSDTSPSVAQECSVSQIRDSLYDTWNHPTLSAYLAKSHDNAITSLYSKTKPSKSKSKNHITTLDGVTSAFKMKLDAINLASYQINADTATFIRPSKNSDHNVLTEVRSTPEFSAAQFQSEREAVITVSVHTKSPWVSGNVNRSSQHVLLSSQTLADLLAAIPCTSNELEADDVAEDHELHGFGSCFICIEGSVYSNGDSHPDYAQKLVTHLQAISRGSPAISKAPKTVQETQLSSLLLRINHPYWLVHKGNCEHFIVVDQIRVRHPSDPLSGYPLTLQITPPLLDLCRVCVKVPAVLAVTGDVRLGDSPCLLCRSCWRHMGEPSESDSKVIVNTLPSYSSGWQLST